MQWDYGRGHRCLSASLFSSYVRSHLFINSLLLPSTPSLHSMIFFLWFFVPFIQICILPPLSLPRCGTRSACIPLVSTPRHLSFSRRLCLSVGNWQDGKRVDTERVKSRSGLNRKSRRKGEKCSCSSSAFTVSRCCC